MFLEHGLEFGGVLLVDHADGAATPAGTSKSRTNRPGVEGHRNKFIELWMRTFVQVTTALVRFDHQLAKAFDILRGFADSTKFVHPKRLIIDVLRPLVQLKFIDRLADARQEDFFKFILVDACRSKEK